MGEREQGGVAKEVFGNPMVSIDRISDMVIRAAFAFA